MCQMIVSLEAEIDLLFFIWLWCLLDKHVCIFSFMYLLKDITIDCILIQEAGLATNPFDITGLLFTNLPETENDERY